MEEFIENFNKYKEFIQFAKTNPEEPITTRDCILKFEEYGLNNYF